MTRAGAEQWVIASAATTAGLYAYLRWRGQQKTPTEVFVTGWGVVYVTLSVMTLASPGLGAGFAILIMTADLLANLQSVTDEIAKVEGGAGAPALTTPPAPEGDPK